MNVQIPVKWLQELLALCGPEDHELRERVMVSITAMDEQTARAVAMPEPDKQVKELMVLIGKYGSAVEANSTGNPSNYTLASDESAAYEAIKAKLRALLATVTGKSGSNDSPLLAGVSAPAAQSVANADGRFTKNPVTIDAIKWTGSNLREVIAFTDGPPDTRSTHAGMAWEAYVDLVARDGLKIYTLEGKMLANIGDWIIRGIKGEYYPCKPDIFEATYTSAPQAQADARDAECLDWLDAQVKRHPVHNGYLWQEGGYEENRGLVCAIQKPKQKQTARQAIRAAIEAAQGGGHG